MMLILQFTCLFVAVICTIGDASPVDLSKRILLEDNYYSIISRLDALTKEMEVVKAKLGFQRRVLFLLTAIRNSVAVAPPETGVEGMKLVKIGDMEKLRDLEDELGDSDKFASLKLSLLGIGGVTAADHTKRAMEKMLHNSLMAQMNLTGKKGKYAFRDSRLFQAIAEAVKASHPGTTETVVQEAVQKYLKYAPERSGGGGRKDRQSFSVLT